MRLSTFLNKFRKIAKSDYFKLDISEQIRGLTQGYVSCPITAVHSKKIGMSPNLTTYWSFSGQDLGLSKKITLLIVDAADNNISHYTGLNKQKCKEIRKSLINIIKGN